MGFPGSPRLLRAGLVVVDSSTLAIQRSIALQYNPDSLSRSLAVRGATGDSGDRLDALRLTGPPVETLKLDAELDATDELETPSKFPDTVRLGLHPQLAALETLIYPSSAQIQSDNTLAMAGTIEIAPMEAPLVLFVWSTSRVVPVRITEFSITEEAFDVNLNPIRAKVSLGMRVLSTNDLNFDHKGNHIFLAYQQNKERLAGKVGSVSLRSLGITGIAS
ncbi:hypothetical protein [Granulicella tundricola]|uniref:Uncharacterized protein n=1 Tax=Granulicella tundricola (strain ATCC BAA-1859 / DSM 23138 / MP5ACTX9) TaxID=1198114 RepID=E8X5E3_GRATM|nr:hypothetical protein [Granulicella tundricola]ADW69490.1 hypothetical protein AciX9_2455 [Granulicella tundricola MP5ACTX9]